MASSPTLWTIGHSTRPIEELIDLLSSFGITLLVDVRTIPRSRHNPQFNRETLPERLRRAGIAYRHEPSLGGLRRPRRDSTNLAWRNPGFRGFADYMETDEFEHGLDALEDLARRERVAVLCAEAVPWRCHRSLISDAWTARGHEARHILGAGRDQAHALSSHARIHGARVTYPGIVS